MLTWKREQQRVPSAYRWLVSMQYTTRCCFSSSLCLSRCSELIIPFEVHQFSAVSIAYTHLQYDPARERMWSKVIPQFTGIYQVCLSDTLYPLRDARTTPCAFADLKPSTLDTSEAHIAALTAHIVLDLTLRHCLILLCRAQIVNARVILR